MKTKKTLCVLLTLVMLLGILPTAALADEMDDTKAALQAAWADLEPFLDGGGSGSAKTAAYNAFVEAVAAARAAGWTDAKIGKWVHVSELGLDNLDELMGALAEMFQNLAAARTNAEAAFAAIVLEPYASFLETRAAAIQAYSSAYGAGWSTSEIATFNNYDKYLAMEAKYEEYESAVAAAKQATIAAFGALADLREDIDAGNYTGEVAAALTAADAAVANALEFGFTMEAISYVRDFGNGNLEYNFPGYDSYAAALALREAQPEPAAFGITTQPVDFKGVVGKTARFTVEAEGEGLTYKWQFKEPGGTKWYTSSSTGATATCAIRADRFGRQYRCIVSDAHGNKETSNVVTIVEAMKITAQPVDFEGGVGNTATFTVAAEGDGLSYKWQFRDVGATKWVISSTNTGATATCVIREGRIGRQYRCVVTDAYGNKLTSEPAAIVEVIKITSQPTDYAGAIGKTARFTVAAAGEGELTYQWQFKEPGGKKWCTSSSTSTTATCVIRAERVGRQYRCIVTDAAGNKLTSATATIVLAG